MDDNRKKDTSQAERRREPPESSSAWIMNAINQLTHRFERLEDKIDKRVGAIEGKIDERVGALEKDVAKFRRLMWIAVGFLIAATLVFNIVRPLIDFPVQITIGPAQSMPTSSQNP